ncbi:hypothetical protein GJ744_008882 [Endocarpon pusillum]|uniref:Mitochondrial pyruvate carrier n=1 Tax=Endocarpon pusillum TaxID=364733 RepID=A0A8H7AQV9_9EURO|nr:hypothetical protein GJ744_008882 [Endocarpon pusillum]
MPSSSPFRLLFAKTHQFTTFRAPFLLRQQRNQIFRRYQQTVAGTPTVEGAPGAKQSIIQRLWTSEVGVKTVHFWAPVMKWVIVLAGVSDFFRPAEKLSMTQNLALMATGSIWTRWCFIIKPKNYLLAAANFCVAIVATLQVSRILIYRASVKGSKAKALEESKEEIRSAAKGVKEDVMKVVP